MPNHHEIYRMHAGHYQQMISKQPNLLPIIEKIRPPAGLDIADIGAGTGRFTVPLAAAARSIIALDSSEAMLEWNAARLQALELSNWRTIVTDHCTRWPLPDHSIDLAIAGWTVSYVANNDVLNWRANLEHCMFELQRVLRPGGTSILFETLGTGCEAPSAPKFLKEYYHCLTEKYHFSHQWIRTDYTFDDLTQAERLTRFFFGDSLADHVIRERLIHLPECAGVWWKHW
jgi:ubiquinone/menaquinone biosynthesis C-methylase UbiE